MKTILKWFTTIALALFMMAPVGFAAVNNGGGSLQDTTHSLKMEQVSFTHPAAAKTSETIYYRGSYHSGSRAPSSRVSGSRYSSSRTGTTYGSTGRSMFGGGLFGGGLGSHLFSFGTGWFIGSMFHPFGGYYGYGYHSFSLLGILFDILIIWIIWRIIRRIFR
jgi:hypothetical protein